MMKFNKLWMVLVITLLVVVGIGAIVYDSQAEAVIEFKKQLVSNAEISKEVVGSAKIDRVICSITKIDEKTNVVLEEECRACYTVNDINNIGLGDCINIKKSDSELMVKNKIKERVKEMLKINVPNPVVDYKHLNIDNTIINVNT